MHVHTIKVCMIAHSKTNLPCPIASLKLQRECVLEANQFKRFFGLSCLEHVVLILVSPFMFCVPRACFYEPVHQC